MTVILVLVSSITLQPFYYTNTNYYYEIMYKNNTLYGATNGGLITYNLNQGAFLILTNSDGLPKNRQTCCAFDSSGYVWCGNENGLALVDSLFSAVYQYPVEIISSFVQDIVTLTDSVYVGSPAGLLFIQTQGTPDDFSDDSRTRLYVQNGLLSNNVETIAVQDRYIWVGTDQGITRFVKSFNPDSFDQYTVASGLASNDIRHIEVIRDTVYVATGLGLNVFDGSDFDTLLFNYEINAISYLGDTIALALADSFLQVGMYYQDTLFIVNDGLPYKCRVMDFENVNGTLYCGLGNRWNVDPFGMGFGTFDGLAGEWLLTVRECLPSNHIAEISANQHSVFCAHGARAPYSRGIGILDDDGQWTNFTRDSLLSSNHVHRCVTAPDGWVWFAINAFSGAGSDTIMLFSYEPVSGVWRFIPCGYLNIDGTVAVWDIEFDNANNLYMALAGPSDKLWVVDSSLQTAIFLGEYREGFNIEIAIDSTDVVYRTVFGSDGGLIMTDTRGTIFNRNDDITREYNTSDGMLSKYAYGCIVSGNNTLYVANDTGMITFADGAFRRFADISEQEHFDVELDSEGRVWIMARNGLYLYDPVFEIFDGWEYYELGLDIQFLDFSNEVIQIQAFEFDSLRSCFWLGGETGLLKLSIIQTPDPQLDSILIYPNPVVDVSVVRIKNIPLESQVRIFSISGRLIADNLEPDQVFGEVVWHIPEDVPSGLYFAVVKTPDCKKVCKFAIVR